jgi:hypothetical protein
MEKKAKKKSIHVYNVIQKWINESSEWVSELEIPETPHIVGFFFFLAVLQECSSRTGHT